MKPVRVPISASAISTTKTTTPMPRMCLGAKPRPRKATGRTTASDILQLLVGGGRLLVHQVPQHLLLGGKFRIGDVALGKRRVDLDDLPDASRPARQHDDAVAKAHSLGKIV